MNPFDLVKSFSNFFEDCFFEPGTVSMDAFAREFWLARDIPTSKMQNASYFILCCRGINGDEIQEF
jgi:hypothetical protein